MQRVFHFRDRRLSEIMTPRTEIVWLAKGTTLADFLSLYAEHSHTRFPVLRELKRRCWSAFNKEVLIAQSKGKLGWMIR